MLAVLMVICGLCNYSRTRLCVWHPFSLLWLFQRGVSVGYAEALGGFVVSFMFSFL